MSNDSFAAERGAIPHETHVVDVELSVIIFRAVAAIGLVYGAVGMMLLPFGLLRFHQGAITGDFRVTMLDEPIASTSLDAMWMFTSSLVGAGLAGLLFVGAIGGLHLKNWALHALRIWAIASIILGLGGSYFYLRWLLPATREPLAQVRGVIDSLGNLGGWTIGLVLAIAVLILSHQSAVRAAFSRDEKNSSTS